LTPQAQIMHVLLADDDENDAILMLRAFEKAHKAGCIKVVRNGDEVVDYLMGTDRYADRELYPFPSLLILDVKMPKKNGFEVLEWLKAHPSFKRIPVIVLSSSRQERDVLKAYDLYANSYLVKPGGFEDMVVMASTIRDYWFQLNKLSPRR
jgi:CheY-like chemotaxis protein